MGYDNKNKIKIFNLHFFLKDFFFLKDGLKTGSIVMGVVLAWAWHQSGRGMFTEWAWHSKSGRGTLRSGRGTLPGRGTLLRGVAH